MPAAEAARECAVKPRDWPKPHPPSLCPKITQKCVESQQAFHAHMPVSRQRCLLGRYTVTQLPLQSHMMPVSRQPRY